jgi:serine/threonine-protein kinase HipA
MAVCPITLDPMPDGGPRYSERGLRQLSRTLKDLAPLEFTTEQQIREAASRMEKMSIQGVQPKLSATLQVKQGSFRVVDTGGQFILKPCPPGYAEVPANESLTMSLADVVGIETPVHGLVFAADDSLTYWVRRFDRPARGPKLPQEDFAQLLGRSRETKYDSSLEQTVAAVERFATFPVVEKRKFALLILFCFLTGNEDMHLKNFSLISRIQRGRSLVTLSPAYDLLNTSIILKTSEESALPLRGKKRNLTRNDLVNYFCWERCGLPAKATDILLRQLAEAMPQWEILISRSFLSEGMREAYRAVLQERAKRLGIG